MMQRKYRIEWEDEDWGWKKVPISLSFTIRIGPRFSNTHPFNLEATGLKHRICHIFSHSEKSGNSLISEVSIDHNNYDVILTYSIKHLFSIEIFEQEGFERLKRGSKELYRVLEDFNIPVSHYYGTTNYEDNTMYPFVLEDLSGDQRFVDPMKFYLPFSHKQKFDDEFFNTIKLSMYESHLYRKNLENRIKKMIERGQSPYLFSS